MTTLQGSRLGKRSKNVRGILDTFLGDDCHLSCNLKHLSDEPARQACKLACDMGMTQQQYDQWLASGGTGIAIPRVISPYGADPYGPKDNTLLYVAGAGLIVYLITRKK